VKGRDGRFGDDGDFGGLGQTSQLRPDAREQTGLDGHVVGFVRDVNANNRHATHIVSAAGCPSRGDRFALAPGEAICASATRSLARA
jgi:hypothetical protein